MEDSHEIIKQKLLELANKEVQANRPISLKIFVPLAIRLLKSSEINVQDAMWTLFKDSKLERVSHLIEGIVQELVRDKKILEGRRILPALILNNPKRREIYELICQNPGCSFKTLQTTFAYGVGTIYNHIFYLEEFDLIRATNFGRKKYFFSANSPPEDDLPAILRQKKKYLQLLAQIRARGAVAVNDLKRAMNLHYTTVMYYLKLLEEVGLVTLEVTGKQRRVVISNSEILSKLNL